MILVILLALLPVFILLYYTYQQDKLQREPIRSVTKAFFYGCLSVFASFFLSVPFGMMGLYPEQVSSLSDAFLTAFFGAAIPEESAKLFLLWLFLRKCRDFDERMDGIVYGVAVGLGFAAFENIEYLFASGTDWVTVGLGRSLTAIPGHFGFAVVMGYYYSLYHFDRYKAPGAGVKMWLYPVVGHGLYDTVAMYAQVSPEIGGVITVVLILFCFWLIRLARKRMQEHVCTDIVETYTGIDEQ